MYLCARSPAKASTAISSIKDKCPQARITLLEFDHLSLSTVISAAKLFISREFALHGLVNNAGIMATPFEMTKDGYEAQWQTNYLAHWIFTFHLTPLMLSTSKTLPPGSVRVVNLSSSGHYFTPKGGIASDETALPNAIGMTRYGQSKLANILHAKTIHKLYGPSSSSSNAGKGGIWTTIVHPGLVDTQIGQQAELSALLKAAVKVSAALGGRVDADTGSWTSVFCVASPLMKKEQAGTYFQRIAEAGWQSAMAKDEGLALKLEEWTRGEMERSGWIAR